MSGTIVSAVTNNFPLECSIIRLQDEITHGHEMPFRAGILQSVIEQDDGQIVLACIDNVLVETSKDLAAKLQQLVGRRICLTIVDGKFRIGALRA
jgi:hypothetical protein